MSATSDLLDRVREVANVPSDNVLSQKLGITRAVISGWRKDLYPVPDERIAQLCAMAKLDGPEWLARIHAERAQSPAERALWSKMLVRLAAAAVLIVPMSAFAKSETTSISGTYAANSAGFVYYVQSSMVVVGFPRDLQHSPPAKLSD